MSVAFKVSLQSEFGKEAKDFIQAFDRFSDGTTGTFQKNIVRAHRRGVFKILEFTIKYCRVDTGRLRASFTPYFEHNNMPQYRRSYMNHGTETADAEAEGYSRGYYEENTLGTLSTYIYTGVDYALEVEEGKGLFTDSAPFPSLEVATSSYFEPEYKKSFEQLLGNASDILNKKIGEIEEDGGPPEV